MKRILFFLLETIILTATVFMMLIAGLQYLALVQPLQIQKEELFNISAGQSTNGAFHQLQDKKIVRAASLISLYWEFNETNNYLQVGQYHLIPGSKVKDLLHTFQQGKMITQRVTFIEGWRFQQIKELLDKKETLKHTLLDVSDQKLMKILESPYRSPEGLFFADTYQFTQGVSDITLLKKSYRRLIDILNEEWKKRADNLPYKTPYDALIMASIIEKETGSPDERPRIAGVFVRRLQKKMRLQTDPTVIYGLGDEYTGKITHKDLLKHTPYNTYLIYGLPPTPIAMVGRASIHAALHPTNDNTLYFVAKGNGRHAFSVTLDEHNQAVKKYQLKRKKNYRSTIKKTSSSIKKENES